MNELIKKDILNNAKGMSLGGLFSEFQFHFGNIYKNPKVKEMFFSFLSELLDDGEIKLTLGQDNILTLPTREQIKILRDVWPKEYDPVIPEKDIEVFWWTTTCPIWVVWIYPDGTEVWT